MNRPTQRVPVSLTVNGRRHAITAPAHLSLLDLFRDVLDLTGTKECCTVGECGACTIILDGRPVNSCLVLAAEVDGSDIVTVEGLATAGGLSPLQQAFLDKSAAQCGFCSPGQLITGHALLQANPHPTPDVIREAFAGNLCRCGAYQQILEAVLAAAGDGA